MAKKAGFFKSELRYPSLTTDVTHDSSCFAAEIICMRSAAIKGDRLPPYFWRKDADCAASYKQLFSSGIECFRKLASVVPPHFIIQCCIYSRIDKIEYGYIIATIKNRWTKWCGNVKNRLTNHINNQAHKMSIAEEIIEAASNGGRSDFLAVDEVDHEEIISRSSSVIAARKKVRF